MTNLNSVLLEGNIVGIVEGSLNSVGINVCKFTIESKRHIKNGKEEEVSNFYIVTYGCLADVCQGYLTVGKGVRVVGRLKQDMGGVIVVAEHVEFKPTFEKK